ncbi:hypothetical protein DZF91_06230 [Actinomadura logoneensis]|uniref:Uncharacterized protein n=1 Tax=Actinomadura logoneensis TaxID=2293572 RepID=A0A372JR22_9ACTN|nr:hypothetical protein [Actinomadura logoneensis]RFU42485.1 hypothetical protein DZF91_06230 [Actinomadura logoneensis]
MTTGPHDEHGEILRRALHAEAERVIPSTDGLEHIRARVAERDRERRRFPGRIGWDWFTANWTRPVLAVGAAVAIAGLGVSAPETFDLIQSPMGNDGPFSNGHHSSPSEPGESSIDSPPPMQTPSTPGHETSGTPHPPSSEGPVSSTVSPTCPPPSGRTPAGSPPSHGSGKHPAGSGTGIPGCPTPSPTPSGTPTPSESSTPPTLPSETPPPQPTTTPETHVPEAPVASP